MKKTRETETKTETKTGTTIDAAENAAQTILDPPDKPKRGRPPGSKNKKTDEIEITPGDVQTAGALGATVFGIIGPFARLAPLTPDQTERLGGALAPLLQKYLPLLANWQYEFAALMVVSSIVIEARQAYIPPDLREADEMETESDSSSNHNEAGTRQDPFGRHRG